MASAKEFITGAFLISLFLLNSTTISSVIIFFLLIIIALFSYKSLGNRYFMPFKLLILYSFVTTFIVNINQQIEINEYIRYLSLLIIFLFFPFNVKISNKILIRIIFSTGILIVFFQLGSAYGISAINNLIHRFYPIDIDIWASQSINSISGLNIDGLYSRFGGIYYNPNIMGQNIVLWCILFVNIIDLNRHKLRGFRFYVIGTYSITALSVIISGSRTAMVVFSAFILIKYFYFIKKKKILVLLFVIFAIILSYEFLSNLRIFNISSAITSPEGSFSIKFKILKDWLFTRFQYDVPFLNVLFGDFDLGIQFDSDLGYVLSYFGLIGCFAILLLIINVFRHSRTKRSNFVVFLISIGATIIMNFRFSIITFVILSIAFTSLNKKLKQSNEKSLVVRTNRKS